MQSESVKKEKMFVADAKFGGRNEEYLHVAASRLTLYQFYKLVINACEDSIDLRTGYPLQKISLFVADAKSGGREGTDIECESKI